MRNCDTHAISSAAVSGGIGLGVTRQPSPVLTLPSRRCRSSAPKKSIKALTVRRHEGVEIDKPGNAIARLIGDTRHRHAAIAVPDQHDIAQIFILDDAKHVLNMGFQVVRGTGQMSPFAQPGVARCEEFMSGRRHERPHLLPGPRRRPGAVGEHDSAPSVPPLVFQRAVSIVSCSVTRSVCRRLPTRQ